MSLISMGFACPPLFLQFDLLSLYFSHTIYMYVVAFAGSILVYRNLPSASFDKALALMFFLHSTHIHYFWWPCMDDSMQDLTAK